MQITEIALKCLTALQQGSRSPSEEKAAKLSRLSQCVHTHVPGKDEKCMIVIKWVRDKRYDNDVLITNVYCCYLPYEKYSNKIMKILFCIHRFHNQQG